ncbi:MAG: hypothetical protein Q8K60_03435 [Parachlamydiaceae bacterium]|nr:hypothetical protein [Parachlamydiaceae bacterium]
MNLIDINSEHNEFDKFCMFLNGIPNVLWKLFDNKNNNYHSVVQMLHNSRLLPRNISDCYSAYIPNYEKNITYCLRKARIAKLFDKENDFVKRFNENGYVLMGLDIQFNYINRLWLELEDEIENNQIDCSDEKQLNLLIHLTGFITFYLGIVQYIYPNLTEIIELLDYLNYALLDIHNEVVAA